MLTSDISLKYDSNYTQWANNYLNLDLLATNFAHAWYKLMTRDMGPITRCVGNLSWPAQDFQYPLPDPPTVFPDWSLVKAAVRDVMNTKSDILPPDTKTDKTPSYSAAFATLAWQCSSTFRRSDWLGGCNGARIRFKPQADWRENTNMDKVISILGPVQAKFKNLSMADLIIFAGQVALEDTANFSLPYFCPGRVDATDGEASTYLGGYNYTGLNLTAGQIFIHKATAMGLSLREAVALRASPRSKVIQQGLGYRGS